MASYLIYNGAMPTTGGPPAGVATSASLFTMLQVVPAAGFPMQIVEWGVSFNGSALAAGFPCSLVETGTVAATVTSFAAADLMPYDDPNAPVNTTAGATSFPLEMSTALSGFTSSAEGTITAQRVFDTQLVEPIGGYSRQFPLGERPSIKPQSIARIMVKGDGTTKVVCYMVVRF